MSAQITFVMGRSGSGKTELLFNKIKQNELSGKRSVLIVPDRASFESERRLAKLIGKGMMNTFVVSFTRLARRILSEKGEKRVFLSIQGRQMMLKKTIENITSDLECFSRIASKVGFTAECDEIILKCKRFGITSEQLMQTAENVDLPYSLRGKLFDFAKIYEAAENAMSSSFIDDEDIVNSLIDNLPSSSYDDCDFFIDTPETLTEQSIRIISTLMDCAANITITFRGDTSEVCRDRKLFQPDENIYRRIRAEAESKHCIVNFVSLTQNTRVKVPEMKHLERELFAFPYRIFNSKPTSDTTIELHIAANKRLETVACCEKIRNAVNSGLRYRDIGIIVSDIEGYATTIKRVFSEYEIPYFMDVKRSLFSHPLSTLILSAIACCESRFRAKNFIQALKSGMFPIEDNVIEKLENHILKYGLSGSLITEPFNQENVSEEIELARATAVEPIINLKRKMAGKHTTAQRLEALYEFTEQMNVGEMLRLEYEKYIDCGNITAARETAQVYDTFIELIDQIHAISGDEEISLKRFSSVLEEGLRDYAIGIIPTTLDSVYIGSVDNSGVAEVELIIVMGATEGAFPQAKPDNSIINDSELRKLAKIGLPVWSTSEKMNKDENLRVYSALMKAKSGIYLSFSYSGGNSVASSLFERTRKMFPNCRITNGILSPVKGSTERAGFSNLISSLKSAIYNGMDELENCADDYAYFTSSEEYARRLDVMNDALFVTNTNAALGKNVALKLYGKNIYGSPTKLETFAKCPFRYFMEYGIGIKQREQYEEKATDRGSFIHEVLERFLKGVITDNVDWKELTDSEVENRLLEIVSEVSKTHNKGIYLSSARMRAELKRLTETILIAALEIRNQIINGSFRPLSSEISFGRPGDALPPLTIRTDDGACFNVCGIVDRLDTFSFEKSNRDYLRIVDYKTGETNFSYTEIVNGIRLQLPLYAAAMEAALTAEKKLELNPNYSANKENATAGLYYQYIGSPDAATDGLDGEDAEEVKKALRDSFKLRGLTLGDYDVVRAIDSNSQSYSGVVKGLRFVKSGINGNLADANEMRYLINFSKDAAARILNSIMQGHIQISPIKAEGKTGCTYCSMQSVCGFDPTAAGRYRNTQKVSADTFFNRNNKRNHDDS